MPLRNKFAFQDLTPGLSAEVDQNKSISAGSPKTEQIYCDAGFFSQII